MPRERSARRPTSCRTARPFLRHVRRIVTATQRVAWAIARGGLVLAALVALIAGIAAGVASKALADQLMIASFFIALPAVALGWLGFPEATRHTTTQEHLS